LKKSICHFPAAPNYVDFAEIEVNIRVDLSFLFNVFVWQMVSHRRFYTFFAGPHPLKFG
jgi:hypothetical protein